MGARFRKWKQRKFSPASTARSPNSAAEPVKGSGAPREEKSDLTVNIWPFCPPQEFAAMERLQFYAKAVLTWRFRRRLIIAVLRVERESEREGKWVKCGVWNVSNQMHWPILKTNPGKAICVALKHWRPGRHGFKQEKKKPKDVWTSQKRAAQNK